MGGNAIIIIKHSLEKCKREGKIIGREKLEVAKHPNHAMGVYIIKPQEDERRCEMRYKGSSLPLMICAALCASMICQACGLDKQKRNFW